MRRYELTNEAWELIRDLFPISSGKGRPWRDHRMMVNAMLWILNSGSPWRDLPERYGPWQTAYNRFNRWRRDGTLRRHCATVADPAGCGRPHRLGLVVRRRQFDPGSRCRSRSRSKRGVDEPADHALGHSRGGFGTKIHVVSDGQGTPLAIHLTAGQVHESRGLGVVDAVRIPRRLGRPRTRPRRIAGDKAYDFSQVRAWLRSRRLGVVIPRRKPRSKPKVAQPRSFDRAAYKRRNVVERCIGWLKHARRIATRFEKTAVNFLAMLKLAMIQRYLKVHLRDTT